MPLHKDPRGAAAGSPLKTRYTIIEPGPLRGDDLVSLTWIDHEFRSDAPKLEELNSVLDPLFPNAEGWERVAVNSFNGAADMFVDENGAGAYGNPVLPINEAATLIYWTASMMHKLAADRGQSWSWTKADDEDLRKRALLAAAYRLKETGNVHADVPRIHGRAVLFDGQVWF